MKADRTEHLAEEEVKKFALKQYVEEEFVLPSILQLQKACSSLPLAIAPVGCLRCIEAQRCPCVPRPGCSHFCFPGPLHHAPGPLRATSRVACKHFRPDGAPSETVSAFETFMARRSMSSEYLL